jgi:hypothetical protein
MMILFLLLAALVESPVTPPEAVPADNKSSKTRLEMRVAEAVLHAYEENGGKPVEMDDGPISPRDLQEKLGSPYGERLPSKDGWGRALRYWRSHDQWMITSSGPDGRDDPGMSAPITDRLVWVDDIVLVGKKFLSPSSVMMSTLRTLGTAIEAYAVDKDLYPGPTNGLVPVSEVERALVPIYLRELPKRDAWGNAILYYSDARSYLLVSLGSDGKPDAEYDPRTAGWGQGKGETASPQSDLLFVNGQFTQWPANMDPE